MIKYRDEIESSWRGFWWAMAGIVAVLAFAFAVMASSCQITRRLPEFIPSVPVNSLQDTVDYEQQK